MKIALIPGSFDPFTNGHLDIVKRSLRLMDKVIIAIGVNSSKKGLLTAEERLTIIKNIFVDEPRVEVALYNNLTTEFAKEMSADFIIRGVRNFKDFEYESNMADINRQISDVETIILISDPQLSIVSSSMVKELLHFKADISRFVPKQVVDSLKKSSCNK